MRQFWILTIVLVVATPALAETRIVDGDTLDIDGERIRLWGIDAPERDQICVVDGAPARIGVIAADVLAEFIDGVRPDCTAIDTDPYGRTVAQCSVDGSDLGSMMVQVGLAWDWPRYSGEYYAFEQESARRNDLGVWGWGCEWHRS